MPKDLYVDNHSCHPLKSWPSWPQECATGNALAPRTIHHGCLGGLFSAQKQFLAFFLEDSSLLTSIPKNWAKIEAVSAMIRSLWKKIVYPSPKPDIYRVGTEKWVWENAIGDDSAMFIRGIQTGSPMACSVEPRGFWTHRVLLLSNLLQTRDYFEHSMGNVTTGRHEDIIPQNWKRRIVG